MTENQAPIQLVGKLPARGAIEEWSHEDRESAFWIYCDPHQGNRSLRKRERTNYDKVRLDAIKLGLGIASFSEVKKVEADIVTNDITSPKRAKGGSNELKETKSVKELAEKLNAKLAAYSTEDGEDS
jgi:hypothetical protein